MVWPCKELWHWCHHQSAKRQRYHSEEAAYALWRWWVLTMINLQTKLEMSSFTHCKDIRVPKLKKCITWPRSCPLRGWCHSVIVSAVAKLLTFLFNGQRMLSFFSFSGKIFLGSVGLAMESQCTKFEWFGAVRGHKGSATMSPFNRAHTTSYLTLIETMHLSCTVFEI